MNKLKKKFNKAVALLLLVAYTATLCIPMGVDAEEFIQTLDYSYWLAHESVKDYDKAYDKDGALKSFEEYYDELMKQNIEDTYTYQPEMITDSLKERYPDKVAKDKTFFDTYKEEYFDDMVEILYIESYKYDLAYHYGSYDEGEWYDENATKYVEKLSDTDKGNIIKEVKKDYQNFYKTKMYKIYKYILCDDFELTDFKTYNKEYDELYIRAYFFEDYMNKNFSEKDYNQMLEQNYALAYTMYCEAERFGAYGQFNITGNAGLNPRIGVTYNDYGFQTHLLANGVENFIGHIDDLSEYTPNNLKITSKGIEFTRNDLKLIITTKNIDTTTVEVTHTLTNLTDDLIDFNLGISSDIMFGGNDQAAISRTNNSFIITQDATIVGEANPIDVSDTYGAQLNISMSPNPSTVYVGPYHVGEVYGEYKLHVYDNSSKKYYTRADQTDTALAYSWQGSLEAKETRKFVTTFGLNKAVNVDLNFYPLSNDGKYGDATDDSPISVLGGGAFKTPASEHELVKGYHSVWNTKKDGTGTTYEVDSWVVAPVKDTDFYEVMVPNDVVPFENITQNYLNAEITDLDKFKKTVANDLKESYNNVEIELEVIDSNDTISDNDKNLLTKAFSKDYVVGTFFDANIYKIINKDYDGKTPLTEIGEEIEISLILPQNLINSNKNIERTYELLRVHNGKAEKLNATFDRTTRKLTFKTDKFSSYVIAYKDTKLEEDVPETIDNITLFGGILVLGLASLGTIIYLTKNEN